MKSWLLAYALLYVVIEMVGSSLAAVGWPRLTALDVATAVADACLTVSVILAVLLAARLGARRWGPALAAWTARPGEYADVLPDRPIGVRSWRTPPPALPPAAPAPGRVRSTYSIGAYDHGSGRRGRRVAPSFPEDPGRLL